ncbi:5-formyltetrahydrofolate cyclo-ligase [Enterococcus sp. PF1-24]|uniref:5-formyltetrahydrofolate cyclo-ligase n=1 Tax=unclassified Enterococcus TaxID=2608891 RepID=UPI002473883D|nr:MULTISPECIES: 5-formyltetrahydrofolate cyclo-ligase [unclassified Enterococcus]MDH6365282.1 5-formyltetrahydrofolate cyclo-ligase [Enterococcus sp. PFB1-1]MDH6402388.1 5-formyltetrahydrofolate cyclo-ligase [Enterococcus sp. PF1-24]
MDKASLRKEGIRFLEELAQQPTIKKLKEATIYQKLFATEAWQKAKKIGIISSMAIEVDTQPIINEAFKTGKTVGIPKTLPQKQMLFSEIQGDSQLNLTKFGVLEPVVISEIPKEQLDLIIVPGVIFSSEKYRIGFGGGFYDRYLQNFNGTTLSILFKEQLRDDWQKEIFDLPVDYLIVSQ